MHRADDRRCNVYKNYSIVNPGVLRIRTYIGWPGLASLQQQVTTTVLREVVNPTVNLRPTCYISIGRSKAGAAPLCAGNGKYSTTKPMGVDLSDLSNNVHLVANRTAHASPVNCAGYSFFRSHVIASTNYSPNRCLSKSTPPTERRPSTPRRRAPR
jgi:hypothetical protein